MLKRLLEDHPSISYTALGRCLGTHRHTVRRYVEEYGLSKKSTQISDDELDAMVHDFKQKHPNSGAQFLFGYLKSRNVRISWTRLRASRRRVDPIVPALRKAAKIKRRNYESPRSDSVWHHDGHHKLILWGWVIHGIIDGHDRSVRAFIINNYLLIFALTPPICDRFVHFVLQQTIVQTPS